MTVSLPLAVYGTLRPGGGALEHLFQSIAHLASPGGGDEGCERHPANFHAHQIAKVATGDPQARRMASDGSDHTSTIFEIVEQQTAILTTGLTVG